jgi:hypothetical protein
MRRRDAHAGSSPRDARSCVRRAIAASDLQLHRRLALMMTPEPACSQLRAWNETYEWTRG